MPSAAAHSSNSLAVRPDRPHPPNIASRKRSSRDVPGTQLGAVSGLFVGGHHALPPHLRGPQVSREETPSSPRLLRHTRALSFHGRPVASKADRRGSRDRRSDVQAGRKAVVTFPAEANPGWLAARQTRARNALEPGASAVMDTTASCYRGRRLRADCGPQVGARREDLLLLRRHLRAAPALAARATVGDHFQARHAAADVFPGAASLLLTQPWSAAGPARTTPRVCGRVARGLAHRPKVQGALQDPQAALDLQQRAIAQGHRAVLAIQALLRAPWRCRPWGRRCGSLPR